MPGNITSTVTGNICKQLVLLLGWFSLICSPAMSKTYEGISELAPSVYIKNMNKALWKGCSILNATVDITLNKSLYAVKNYFLLPFCRLTHIHNFFLTFRMVADSICGSWCTKMHDPKTQASKTDDSEVNIQPVSAVFHITSDGVKSNQYLNTGGKKKGYGNFLFFFNERKQKKRAMSFLPTPYTYTHTHTPSRKKHNIS